MFLEALKAAIASNEKQTENQIEDQIEDQIENVHIADVSKEERRAVSVLAHDRGVLPLLCIDKQFLDFDFGDTKKSCGDFYHIMYATFEVLDALEKVNIEACVLKGISLAVLYPKAEYRRSADVDILLRNSKDIDDAIMALNIRGWKMDGDILPYHNTLTKDGMELEIHFKPVRPFDSEKLNSFIDKCFSKDNMGFETAKLFGKEFPVLAPALYGFYLLLHGFQHFLWRGMGIKLVADWVVFWNRELQDKVYEEYLSYIEGAGLTNFNFYLTSLAVKYLGLKPEVAGRMSNWTEERMDESEEVLSEFLEEILDAGRYGEMEENRFVSIKGSGIGPMIGEVHHRMKENYPTLSKIFILWPILWCETIIRFMRNNKRKRGVKSLAIIKNARERGRLVKKMDLWS